MEADGASDLASAQLLHTPKQAARILTIPESWLRRKAGLRSIPCTFVGKHLRFSDADLRAIVRDGTRPALRRVPSGQFDACTEYLVARDHI